MEEVLRGEVLRAFTFAIAYHFVVSRLKEVSWKCLKTGQRRLANKKDISFKVGVMMPWEKWHDIHNLAVFLAASLAIGALDMFWENPGFERFFFSLKFL